METDSERVLAGPGRRLSVVLPVVLVVLVLVLIAAVWAKDSGKRSHASSTATGNASTASPAAWSASLQATVDNMGTVFQTIESAAGAQDSSGVASACQSEAAKINGWRATLAEIPVSSVSDPAVQALNDYSQALSLCSTGGSPSDLINAVQDLVNGNALAQQATSAAQSYTSGG